MCGYVDRDFPGSCLMNTPKQYTQTHTHDRDTHKTLTQKTSFIFVFFFKLNFLNIKKKSQYNLSETK